MWDKWFRTRLAQQIVFPYRTVAFLWAFSHLPKETGCGKISPINRCHIGFQAIGEAVSVTFKRTPAFKRAMMARTIFTSMTLLLALHYCNTVEAANCNSTSNGNWTIAANWSCGAAPVAGDQVVISTGKTITINSNITLSGAPLNVTVYGTWNFSGGGAKITLPDNSVVIIASGGKVTGNGTGNSQTIKIGTTTYWSADDGEVNGPWAWPESAMPVELIAFSGMNPSRNNVDLQWATASETNASHFEIDRSIDGDDWTTVANVQAIGNSITTTEYSHMDMTPYPGTWYYRLRQYDIDASLQVESVISVYVGGEMPVICQPSPDGDPYMEVKVLDSDIIGVQVHELNGNKMQTQVINESIFSKRVDLSSLSAGLYVITVTDARGGKRSCKAMVQ
jgi:hypothetical protein